MPTRHVSEDSTRMLAAAGVITILSIPICIGMTAFLAISELAFTWVITGAGHPFTIVPTTADAVTADAVSPSPGVGVAATAAVLGAPAAGVQEIMPGVTTTATVTAIGTATAMATTPATTTTITTATGATPTATSIVQA